MDLAELADICAEKGFRIAYKNYCWATCAPTWRTVWEIVKKANRPNLGLCLNTFQTAAGEFGDPTTRSGLIEELNRAELETRWRNSLTELVATVPAEKIFSLQISDAYKMDPPMDPNSFGRTEAARSRWSHAYRPLPFDGGYLPVHIVLGAILRTGFREWLSVEVFDLGEEERNSGIKEFTTSCMRSLENLLFFSW
jgi:sugar phosphate isomerase/epimerase